MPSNICVYRVLSCVLGPVDKTVWSRTYTRDHYNGGWDPCSWLWACWSLGLLRAREGLGCRWGMLFKTKKEMLAQNGEERKQLPVSAVWEEELLWPLGQWATWSVLESWSAKLSSVECQSPFYLSLGNSSNGLMDSKMNVSAWRFSNMCHGGWHSLGHFTLQQAPWVGVYVAFTPHNNDEWGFWHFFQLGPLISVWGVNACSWWFQGSGAWNVGPQLEFRTLCV